MHYFCTLFDKNYLNRGLALHASLVVWAGDFTLWILAMDDETDEIVSKLSLKNVQVIRLTDFEDEELLREKPTRTAVEYFWTLTPSLPLYILKKYPSLPMITYLDADLFFFSSPQPIFHEFGQNSILLTEHRYSPAYRHFEEKSGKYNVQFLIFRNNRTGKTALEWWRKRCLEWCFNRFENEKFGDQKYLDDWPKRFNGVHVLSHLGAGIAPWNIGNYQIASRDSILYVNSQRLIFYHFHALLQAAKQKFVVSPSYRLTKRDWRLIYQPYFRALNLAWRVIEQKHPHFTIHFASPPSKLSQLTSLLRKFRTRLPKS